MTAALRGAWHGRPGNEARRILRKIGFWIAQPGLDAACQRQFVALTLSRRDVADAATARKRLELQIAELARHDDKPEDPGRNAMGAGQGATAGQLAELRRRQAHLQAEEERVTEVSRRLIAEIHAFRAGQEATRAAYTSAEKAARTLRRR